MRLSHLELLWIPLILSVVACSSVDKYNPFSEPKPAEPYKPANATEYQCEGNQRFFVRMLEQGNAVWLIYPDREVRLDKLSDSGNRYGNGVATLEINAADASLSDGTSINYTACKAAGNSK